MGGCWQALFLIFNLNLRAGEGTISMSFFFFFSLALRPNCGRRGFSGPWDSGSTTTLVCDSYNYLKLTSHRRVTDGLLDD